jgi:hypothetical protein
MNFTHNSTGAPDSRPSRELACTNQALVHAVALAHRCVRAREHDDCGPLVVDHERALAEQARGFSAAKFSGGRHAISSAIASATGRGLRGT